MLKKLFISLVTLFIFHGCDIELQIPNPLAALEDTKLLFGCNYDLVYFVLDTFKIGETHYEWECPDTVICDPGWCDFRLSGHSVWEMGVNSLLNLCESIEFTNPEECN